MEKEINWVSIFKDLEDVTFNKTDILILISTFNRSLSVAELQKECDIAYKNLLPHLKKLKTYKVISIKDNGLGKRKEITANTKDKKVKEFIEACIGFFGTIQLNLDK